MDIGAPEKSAIFFARTDFRNKNRLFGIKRQDRRQHTYLIGKTGTGKSALLNNLIVQDIANGEGLCVVDPHGELVEGVLKKVPRERMGDVIYFNPSDTDFHIGFNVLELPDPRYKHLVASGLMGIFTKIWAGVWSPRMEYILNNCVLALLDTPGSTLLGIPRLLTDKDYRQKVIANVNDPVVKAFWIHEFEGWQDRFRNEAIAPIQNKVGQFLSTSIIRNIVGQAKSTVDIFNVMNEGKIFLVNVSKGRIGEDNSALLGAMLITKIQLAAMERVRIPEDERVDFYLYVDEFQNFATDSFAGILSEARKYRLNLILAHQFVGQLITDQSKNTKIRDAIFGNVGTMIVFRVGATDAEFLENEFTPEFTIEDIVNLPNYHIYLRLMVDGVTARPFSAATLPPLNVQVSSVVEEELIALSRKLYSRPREVVEAEINRWSGVMEVSTGAAPDARPQSGARYEAVCSSCGKTTTLPFEPTPGRPVYCRECLKKIESGEMKPIRMPRVPRASGTAGAATRANEKKYTSALGDLGIEFAQEPEGPAKPPVAKIPSKPKEIQPQGYAKIVPNAEQGASVEPPTAPKAIPRAGLPQEVPVQAPEEEAMTDEAETDQEFLSLSSLKNMDRVQKSAKNVQRGEVDIAALRQAIKASLHASLTADVNGDAPKAAVEQGTDEEEDPIEDEERLRR